MIFTSLFEKDNENENYLRWESIILALFENFKFNYEVLGTLPLPQAKNDIHPSLFLKAFTFYGSQEYYFGEKNHVHFNRYLAYGKNSTHYPTGKQMAYHHFTLETYQHIWLTPLYYISNWQETFPLIFSTQDNYFMESCNATFLFEEKYLKPQNYPLFHSLHEKYFTEKFFLENKIPASLLIHDFNIEELKIPEEIIKTLNFCLKIFFEAALIQFSLQEIFGLFSNKEEMLKYLLENWVYPNGKKISGLSLYQLNLLSFLYLSLHPAATALCYGLYRTKYLITETHRTEFFVPVGDQIISLKDFLKEQIQTYVNFLNNCLFDKKNVQNITTINNHINAVLDLARMFGIGYKTTPEKGVNVHLNSPVDFSPKNMSPHLKSVNFIVEHTPTSPLWRIFYDFCGEWWNKEEIDQVLIGEGTHWERLKNSPRSLAVHIFHKYAANFWKENLEASKCPAKIKNYIKELLSSKYFLP
jgi:hypothetical protein